MVQTCTRMMVAECRVLGATVKNWRGAGAAIVESDDSVSSVYVARKRKHKWGMHCGKTNDGACF